MRWWHWLVGLLAALVVLAIAGDEMPVLFGLVGIAAGLYLVVANGLKLLRRARFGELVVSKRDLAVGESFTLAYRPGSRSRPGLSGVTVGLICRESASFVPPGQATRATDRHDWTVQEVVGGRSGGRAGADQLELRIPPEAMHSFHGTSNSIDWLIEARIRSRDGGTQTVEIPLTVRPELHGDAA